MQLVSFVGGPADGVVMLVSARELSVAVEQPGAPDRGIISGRYDATSTFSPQGYPAWEWVPTAVPESL